jgi:nickel-type superoxide dismutase maturation protease
VRVRRWQQRRWRPLRWEALASRRLRWQRWQRWQWWPWTRAAVAGDSMRPTLQPRDFLVVRRRGRAARVGDVVVVRRPDRPELLVVKRVVEVDADGALWVLGDNPAASDDSRVFGVVPPRCVMGRVVARYWPRPRRVA